MTSQGPVVAVVGAAQGIGATVARRFAQRGARLVLADIDDLTAVAAETQGVAVRGDVRDERFSRDVVAAALDVHGGLDVVVIAAAVAQPRAEVADLDLESWRHILDVNVTGTFLMLRSAVGPMRRQGSGRLITFTSFYGHTGEPGFAAYTASKAAVRVLTQALAKEVARDGITVNAVAPGYIDTPMGRLAMERTAAAEGSTVAEVLAAREGLVPAGRLGTPDDVAAAVLFLASPEAAYVSGVTLDVNGAVVTR